MGWMCGWYVTLHQTNKYKNTQRSIIINPSIDNFKERLKIMMWSERGILSKNSFCWRKFISKTRQPTVQSFLVNDNTMRGLWSVWSWRHPFWEEIKRINMILWAFVKMIYFTRDHDIYFRIGCDLPHAIVGA